MLLVWFFAIHQWREKEKKESLADCGHALSIFFDFAGFVVLSWKNKIFFPCQASKGKIVEGIQKLRNKFWSRCFQVFDHQVINLRSMVLSCRRYFDLGIFEKNIFLWVCDFWIFFKFCQSHMFGSNPMEKGSPITMGVAWSAIRCCNQRKESSHQGFFFQESRLTTCSLELRQQALLS